MTPNRWVAVGAWSAGLAVALGAFGAHGLESRLDARALALWETAARYLMYGGLGVVLTGVTALHEARRGFDTAAVLLIVGSLVFSGGITAARGHEGDNHGRSAIEDHLLHGGARVAHTPVFGCDLFAESTAEKEAP